MIRGARGFKVNGQVINASARQLFAAAALLGGMALSAAPAMAQSQITTCDNEGIGSVTLSEGTIEDVSTQSTGNVPYCLVKVLVPQAIHIWVGLPMDGTWIGRWQSVGGGGYVGSVSAPTGALAAGYAGAATDTGHMGGDGSFGMLEPGVPNIPLQIDFAYRSEHLMAVLGKELVQAFYGQPPLYSYWNGCSTGGRQGLRMAQEFPDDYDGILAGAPAINWDRFINAEIWPQVVQLRDNGGPIGGGDPATHTAKGNLAISRAIAACDALDGVVDGLLTDPRMCPYSAWADLAITHPDCTPSDPTCLTPTEGTAIDKIWQGPVSCARGGGACRVPNVATRNLEGRRNKRLWYPLTRGAALDGLGGVVPFSIATAQGKYWVYFDPNWDWQTLDYPNYLQFFRDTVDNVGPIMASDNPNLARFRDRGSKVLIWHGFADQLIMPGGTIEYYNRVKRELGGGYAQTQTFARLFLAPGVGHCGGGVGPQPQGLLDAVVNWVENGQAPERILSSNPIPGGTRTRPLCPYPKFAVYTGHGSTDDEANFVCRRLQHEGENEGEDQDD